MREQDQRAGAVDQNVPDAGDQRDDRLADRRPRLHHAVAMRPAKSFWKNAHDWRTTCQWFCQRMRLDTLAAIAWLASRFCIVNVAGRTNQQHQRHDQQQAAVLGEQRLRVCAGHERHHAAEEDRNRSCRASRARSRRRTAQRTAASPGGRNANRMRAAQAGPPAPRICRSASKAVRTARTCSNSAKGRARAHALCRRFREDDPSCMDGGLLEDRRGACHITFGDPSSA